MEKLPYYLWNRNGRWYYRLPEESSSHTTGIRSDKEINKRRAEQWVFKNKVGRAPATELTFMEYTEPYFMWETCPRVQRRIAENRSIEKKHVRLSRQQLEKCVFPDRFAQIPMGKIRRGDLLDLRNRLLSNLATVTVNRTISAVKAVFSEALFREEIDRSDMGVN